MSFECKNFDWFYQVRGVVCDMGIVKMGQLIDWRRCQLIINAKNDQIVPSKICVNQLIVTTVGNSTFLSELKVREGNHYFQNPVRADQVVYVFCDIPHMIKLLRLSSFSVFPLTSDQTLILFVFGELLSLDQEPLNKWF